MDNSSERIETSKQDDPKLKNKQKVNHLHSILKQALLEIMKYHNCTQLKCLASSMVQY